MPLVRKVVIVLVDALPLDVLGCYGGFRESTPGFDRLAALGAVFENALAVKVPGQGSAFGDAGNWTAAWNQVAAALRADGLVIEEHVCTTLNNLTEAAESDAIETFLADPEPGIFAITGPELVPPPVHGHLAVVDQVIASLHAAIEQAESAETLFAVAALQGASPENGDFPRLTGSLVNVPLLIWTAAPVVPGLRSLGLTTPIDVLATALAWLERPAMPELEAKDLLPLLRCEQDEVRDELLLEGPGEIGLRTIDRYAVVQLAGTPTTSAVDGSPSGNGAGAASDLLGTMAEDLDGLLERVAVFRKPADVWDRLDVGNTMPEERDELERRARTLFAERTDS